MKGLGFGLERIGTAALARPFLFAIIIVFVTVFALINIPGVKFNGNVTSVIPQTSENYLNFERQKNNFRNFARDVAVIIRSPRINTASGLEDLRFMQLELAVTEGVASAISLFSIPDPDPETGELKQFFPNQIENDEQAEQLLTRLLTDYPQAGSLISPDENAALLLVALDLGEDVGNDKRAYVAFNAMREAVQEVAPDDFELHFSGLTPIGLTILDALIKDQVKLTLVGLALGGLIAMIFFRSITAAFICFMPPLMTAIWSVGLFATVEVPITYLTTILPALALVLAYADSIVLYHRWAKLNSLSNAPDAAMLKANLREAILRVGPASALTSITTAFAISSFATSQSEALFEFAWLGVILVIFAFMTVIIGIPIIGLTMIRLGLVKGGRDTRRKYSFGRIAARIYQSRPIAIAVVATTVSFGLVYVHTALEPDYNIIDYLPRDSATLKAENLSNDIFGGRSLMFLSIPVVEEGNMTSAANRKRLGEVTELLEENLGGSQVFSLHSLWRGFKESTRAKIANQLEENGGESQIGYISKDGKRMLASVRLPSDLSIMDTSILTKKLKSTINQDLEYGNTIVLTGFPVLLATEFTIMINELRTSLLIAVFLGIVLIGIATRSVFFALAAAVPNLFPILLIEFFIYLDGGNVNVTQVVALTLAFGIAIDNAVHVINVFYAEMKTGKNTQSALRMAVVEVAPALGASTLIICISNIAILTSILPILPIIGQLIIAILIVALFTNLIILPANILTLRRVFGRHPIS